MPEETFEEAQLPLESAGTQLRNARKAAGLSLEEVAARTKIGERQLEAIEADNFENLAGKTYAIGFSRTYARAVGLDDKKIADAVRTQLADAEPYQHTISVEPFEPGDPARVPPSRLAWIAGLAAIAVLVVLAFVWPGFLAPAGTMPDLLKPKPAETQAAPAKAQEDAVPTGGAVVFTALEPDIWVKFYDASGEQLMQKQMAEGESYTVPADAEGPQLWTGRADAFKITVGGKELPRLADVPTTVKDMPVTAEALIERISAPKPASTATAAASE
ncbi:MAG: DUF4115 domain-containing protein [Sphingomonadaceae bacterium]